MSSTKLLESLTNENIYIKKNKNMFKIVDENNKKFILLSPKMYVPFGTENYGKKIILNLEFSYLEKNNVMYNFYSTIKSLDSLLKILKSIDDIDLTNYEYISCIKERPEKYSSLLRTNIKKYGKKIITNIESDDKSKTLYEIKNNYVKVLLELDGLWIWNNKYGVNWVVKTIYA